MGSVPPGLSFDLRPPTFFVPKTITDFLSELSTIPTVPVKLSRLRDFIAQLEDEFRKIDAFKRELPISMLLLNDAIVVLQKEAEKYRVTNSQPVLEEFMPLKKEWDHNDNEEINKDKECRDKKNWLSSVQLCTPSTNNAYDYQQQQQHSKLDTKQKKEVQQRQSLAEDPFQSCSSNRNGGRAIIPFSPFSSIPVTTVTLTTTKEEKEDTAINNRLSLVSSGMKSLREGSVSSGSRSSSSNRAVSSSGQPSLCPGPLQQLQTSRKQRRCWSPELHRRFVNALQKLGGPQAATPKQIRELMQVDGLTNDEVKSHLQKYRLHTRRVQPTAANESVVVLRGLWMSQDQYNESSKGSSSGSGSPKSPLHLTAGSRGGTSSPPTEEGDSMEDDEDARSDISWKIHIHKPANVDDV